MTARRVDVGDEPAAQDHLDRVGQADQLVQVGRDQQHRQAVAPGRRGCGPRSPPGRRRRRRGSGATAMSTLGSPLISRPTMSFCWLPPDSEAARTSMPGVRTSYSSTIRWVSLRAPARSIQTPVDVRRLGLVAEDPVLPQRRLEQQAVPVPVLRDVADAGLAPAPGRPVGRGRCRRALIRPDSSGRMPMMASTSSAWPLPSTPAMPSTSPRWIVEARCPRSAPARSPTGR